MSNAAHTPRPWYVCHHDDNGETVVRQSGGDILANLQCDLYDAENRATEIMANARLIAAAPDLLAAAKAIVRRLDNGDSIEPGWYEAENLRAAIAQAKAGS